MISAIRCAAAANGRPTWDDYFMSVAMIIATRSSSEKKKVGAVIVHDNRVVSSGYNGVPSGMRHTCVLVDGKEVNTIHGEQNAIADAARRGVPIQGSVMYVTHSPCIECTKVIIASGIKEVKYCDTGSVPKLLHLIDAMFVESGVKKIKLAMVPPAILPAIPHVVPPAIPPMVPMLGSSAACRDCEHAKLCVSHVCAAHGR